MTSTRDWQRRKVGSYRTVFTVQDKPGNNLFSFLVAQVAGRLSFAYRLGSGQANHYYIPAGQEDVVFGAGKTVAVQLRWDHATQHLYIDGSLRATSSHTASTPAWSAASVLTLGGNNVPAAGVYNVSDDTISNFVVTTTAAPAAADTVSPSVPANVKAIASSSTLVNLSWTASTDNVGVARYRVFRDQTEIGSTTATTYADPGVKASTSYSYQLLAVDAANNVSAKSAAALVTTPAGTAAGNAPDPGSGNTTPTNPLTMASNTWVPVPVSYTGAPQGGQIWPMSWNSMGVYDPVSKRTIVFDRWADATRNRSIYANALLAFNPSSSVVEVLKLNNWQVVQKANGGYTTEPLPANATDPTPVDRHPFGGLALDTHTNHVYLVNGLNATSTTFPQDTWKFNLTTRAWTKVADAKTTHPPNDGGKFSSLIYNSVERKLVQFLVRLGIGTQTWVLDPATDKWTLLPEDPSSKGVFVSGAGMAYDSKRNRILAYAGGSSYWITGSQLWSYSLAENKWTRLADGPTATTAPEFAYDSTNDVFVALVNDATLVYKPATNTWNRLPTPASVSRGHVTNFQNLTYSPAHDVFVFQGGTYDKPVWYLFRYDPTSLPALPADNEAPAIPAGVTAAAVSSKQIDITWPAGTDNVGVVAYRVYTQGSLRGTVTTTSFTEANLLPSMTYAFSVAAVDATGNVSAQSTPVTARTLAASTTPDTTLPVISAVAAGNLTATSAVITWTTSELSDSQVEYGLTTDYGQSSPLASSPVTAHRITLAGLLPATKYHFRVRSKDPAGNVATSPNMSFTTVAGTATADTQPPSVPAGLRAVTASASQVNLSWSAATDNVGVQGYKVYRDAVAVANVAGTSYNDAGLRAATTYAYRVAAVDAAGNTSALSSAVSATTSAAAATNAKPAGSFDNIADGKLTGWAHDPDDLSKPVKVYIYIDKNAGQAGAMAAEVLASEYRPEVNSHAFEYVIPDLYRDNRPHTVWVWAADLTDTSASSTVELAGSPKSFTLAPTSTTPPPAPGSLSVPLTIQEAIYPGSIAGLNRASDPLTVGIPLPDQSGITAESQLGLMGAAAGQFRILGRWPSGHAKWVLIDTLADLPAGGTNTSMTLTTGAGTFGGPTLATDQGGTITVDTGAARFTIRKANFNGVDEAIVNGKTLVARGTSQGLVVTGPAPGETTCGTCTTIYSSANDSQSTAVIEENGPVRAVVKATGYHKSATGAPYMGFTVRLTFYKGKSHVKLQSTLRNADYGPSNSFNSAYKGFESYELQLANALSGGKTFTFGSHTAPVTGNLGASDSAYLYQATSESLRHGHWCGYLCVPYTTDTGYQIVKNGTPLLTGLTTGANKQYPQGWADITDSSGAGISVGVYQLSAYWPKSLEFNSGGADVRVGIWPKHNSIPYYQTWPEYSTHNLYLNFHSEALQSPSDEFLKFQHYLLARAGREHYNETKVFPYPLLDPTEEDNFYKEVGATANPATISPGRACCIEDMGTKSNVFALSIFRWFGWQSAGGGAMGNQSEFRWSFLQNYLTRGWAGRYLLAAHFYHFQAEQVFPRSDGFAWRDRPLSEMNAFGFPGGIVAANSSFAHRNWIDQEHAHWYGMLDYYFMTGDESIRDAVLDGVKDRYLNSKVMVNNPLMNASSGLYNTRSVGAQLMATARLYEFLRATGDGDADAVLAQGKKTYDMQVKPELCVSDTPAGCNPGALDITQGGVDSGTRGVSRTRGLHWGVSGRSGTFCGEKHNYRVNSAFQNSILMQGMWEFRKAMGPTWTDYENSLDLAYGMSQWAMTEVYADDGSGRWNTNGFRYGVALDVPTACDAGVYNPYVGATVWFPFLIQHEVTGTLDWEHRFKTVLRKNMASIGVGSTDFGTFQVNVVLDKLKRPSPFKLIDVTVASRELGNGAYELSWIVPARAQSYRIKWAPNTIVNWIGFDAGTNTWLSDPAGKTPWFAATNIANEPAPAAAGTRQTFTITGLPAGLTSASFSVRAFVAGL